MTPSTLAVPLSGSGDVRALAPLRDDVAGPIDGPACDVCPHPRADHDRIAARFCSATGTGAIARGCVCRS